MDAVPAFAPDHYRQNVFVPDGASAGPLPDPRIRKWRLALGITRFVFAMVSTGIVIASAVRHDVTIAYAFFAVIAPAYVAAIAETLLGLIWLYRMWAWIPPAERHTKLWRRYISPSAAVGMMFIPYFSIFWMFVVYLGMVDVFERLESSFPTKQESPRRLAMVALIGSMVFFPAAPILHYLLDTRVESLAAAMQSRMGRPIS